MSAAAALDAARALHAPVLLAEVIDALSPKTEGVYVDATFGAGGYSVALLEAGAGRVLAIDRDPEAVARGREWASLFDGRLEIVEGRFGDLAALAAGAGAILGVVFDIGVSSMQIDQAGRGFSFMKDGPLDMRMEGEGASAADLINEAGEAALADIFFRYGEERAARRLARAVVRARKAGRIETTLALADLIESQSPRPKPGQPHAATRVFQALRIAVNDELGELARGLAGAEQALAPGGVLAVVTFHSLEDRIAKRFLAARSGRAGAGSRHAPEIAAPDPGFTLLHRRAVDPSKEEIARNPRARSARLRAATRTGAAPAPVPPSALGLPQAPDLKGLI